MNASTVPSRIDSETPADGAVELVWPLTLIAILAVLWVLWYLRLLDIDIGRIAWLLALAAAVHILLAPVLARGSGARMGAVVLLAIHGLSLLLLGIVWMLLGAMNQPLFLLFFAAPVLVAPTVRGAWGRATAFGLALAVVILTALLSSPSLRWYGAQIGLPLTILDPVSALLSSLGTPAEQSIAPTAALVSIGLFAAALAALYTCASGLTAASRRGTDWLRESLVILSKDQGLALELLDSSPLPEALVLPESARIVRVNDRFRSVFASDGASMQGLHLSERVKLQFPEVLERLVQSGDGVLDARYTAPDGRLREARVHVRKSRHEDAHVTRVSFEDRTAVRLLEGALDAVEHVLLLLDVDETLVYANTAARALFPVAVSGTKAMAFLRRTDLPETWWRTPLDTCFPRQLSISGTEYRGKVCSRRLDGLSEPFTVILLAVSGPS
jgi:PAS domain-containing protein